MTLYEFLDRKRHNDYDDYDITDPFNWERLERDYVNENTDDLIDWEVDSILGNHGDDDDFLMELLNIGEDDFKLLTALNKEELISKYVKANLNSCLDWEIIDEQIREELDKEYYSGYYDVEQKIYEAINNNKELIADSNFKLKLDQQTSHSWNAGRWVSEYFFLTIYDIDNNELAEFTIRYCDGHDNGQSNDYQINFHFYKKEKFKEDIDLIIKDLIDIAKDNTDFS